MLQKLGFTADLALHLETFNPNSLLGYRCQPPQHCLSSVIVERNIVPLWESGVVLTYFNPNSRFFEQCSLEVIDVPLYRLASAQSVLADLIIDLYEDELTIEELYKVATIVGFRSIEQLITEAMSHQGKSYISWRTNFPATCQDEQMVQVVRSAHWDGINLTP